MPFALDTNFLICAERLNDAERAERIMSIQLALRPANLILPTQALGEFYHALTRKFRLPAALAASKCDEWRKTTLFHVAHPETWSEAFDLAPRSGLQFWDALILCTAADARCIALLSEDMQHGFVHRGVTVINPFAEPMHPLLADALAHPR